MGDTMLEPDGPGKFPEPVWPCEFCGRDVQPDAIGTYVLVQGWAEKRAAGGTNALRLRRSLSKVAHSVCVEIAVRGGVEQQTLI